MGQTLLAAARAWQGFDGRHARSWLLRILKNEHLQNLRKGASRPQFAPLEDAEPADLQTWERLGERSETEEILRELDNLPEEFRLAVTLCDIEQLSYEEAAMAMGVRVGTVRSRLFRGRRLLRDRLKHIREGN